MLVHHNSWFISIKLIQGWIFGENRPKSSSHTIKIITKFPTPYSHQCKITSQVFIFDRFSYGYQGPRSYDVIQLFPTNSSDPSSHIYLKHACYPVYKENLNIIKHWKKSVFFSDASRQIWFNCRVIMAGNAVHRFCPIAMINHVSLAKNKPNLVKKSQFQISEKSFFPTENSYSLPEKRILHFQGHSSLGKWFWKRSIFLFFWFSHFLCKLRIFHEVSSPWKKYQFLCRTFFCDETTLLEQIHDGKAFFCAHGCQLIRFNEQNRPYVWKWMKLTKLQSLVSTTHFHATAT